MTSTSSFSSINHPSSPPDLTKPSFNLTTRPNTDVWEKPPSTHSFNAPIVYQSLTKSAFKKASVTVTAEWKQLYDQGGLCLVINDATDRSSRKWVKAGIEFFNEEPNISVVATDRWSDWSLRPMPTGSGREARIEIESNEDGSLWVWLLESDGKRVPLREVAWWGVVGEEQECWVGVYAAKPSKDGGDLVVEFKDFAVETR